MSAWGKSTEFFYQLTPDVILESVQAANVEATGRCLQRNSLENRVYEIEVESDSETKNDHFRIVKFYRPGRWSAEQILEEHRFLFDLTENEIPCVAPLAFPDGETLKKSRDGDIYFALFAKSGGRQLDEFAGAQLEQFGRLVSRVHTVGASRKSNHRIEINERTYGLDHLRFLIDSKVIPESMQRSYQETAEAICTDYAEKLSALMQPNEFMPAISLHRIHGDCHAGNVLWRENGPFLIDFDDMVSGPAVQDLWLMAQTDLNDVNFEESEDDSGETTNQSMERILSGYSELRDFDRRSLKLVEHLRAFRFIHFSAWIAKRWEDPAFPGAFPDFGTERYWSIQLDDLRDQLSMIQQSS